MNRIIPIFVKLLLLLLTLSNCCDGLFEGRFNDQHVTYLHAGVPHVQDALTMLQTFYSQNRIHIYCRRDQPLKMRNIFQSNRLLLMTQAPSAKYSQYKAPTAQGVYDAHLAHKECFEGKFLSGRNKGLHYISLPAHAHYCYGIFTDQAYNLTLLQDRCDTERVARFTLGFIMWLIEVATSLSESLICVYSVAALMGIHLASVVVVCVALFYHGDRKLSSIQPVSTNFKLVLEQYPTSVAVALVGGVFILVNFCQDHHSLWRHAWVRSLFRRFMRLLACLFIMNASNNSVFGWLCLTCLMPWPELWWLLQWLQLKLIKFQRHLLPPAFRRLLSEREFEAQAGYETQRALSEMRQRLRTASPDWEQLAQLQAPQQFAQFISSGIHEPDQSLRRIGAEPHMQRGQTAALTGPVPAPAPGPDSDLDPEATMLRHLAAVMDSDSTQSLDSASTESLCRQLQFGSTRSLQC
ncbi:PREDICTED: uncharacterized protein LOC108611944 [Drosophila arizonae]|uniref:Uncharacterized protein LOC108611944 n=1 Tax=Drosophila arizonae TaxID=7263 RepID=A0ABM1NZA0_DROAR|nr:PREDICTED: uncharacterized protein LOC108611944 [Drosophila arizonae]